MLPLHQLAKANLISHGRARQATWPVRANKNHGSSGKPDLACIIDKRLKAGTDTAGEVPGVQRLL